ncbi:hypothetical protein B5F40_10830 [Gordonibacter sp. An230]|uniref:3-oxoacyl-[acyl-carrier-protein] synthase III C-terminal domain-containing protein n=1 Tax=Gordonibacter sp. An230 TaxID=1965592 RepID=UPI000B38AB8B|nr:3-oxoacyl-[acyl-carrier-protein] synthase III C-terminal domain-containing protein [Gordonibacter sp. An230]OUO89481.1 hypothetical protein B5F40_10830 [Gordonibacter sp. An230]
MNESKGMRIAGSGYALPVRKVTFGDQVRYRLAHPGGYLALVEEAVECALESAGATIGDVDCIVAGMATPLKAIPCNAALVHERVGAVEGTPAFDVNSSCTSFVTALDMASCLIACGRYSRILIVSGDIASAALNPEERESYELFSDVCTAFVVEPSSDGAGVEYSRQATWSEGISCTEIPRGGSLSSAHAITDENRSEYYFTMDGLRTARLATKKLIPFVGECLSDCGVSRDDVPFIVPHQASRMLGAIMKRLGVASGGYIDVVREYGNMVSGSIPFALCLAMESGRVLPGQRVMLLGTAAGLTANFMLLRL